MKRKIRQAMFAFLLDIGCDSNVGVEIDEWDEPNKKYTDIREYLDHLISRDRKLDESGRASLLTFRNL